MKQAENSSVSFRIEVTYYHSPALLLQSGNCTQNPENLILLCSDQPGKNAEPN
jgi:hypothetical protein